MNHNLGKIGEEVARKYLSSKGYRIIERNFHTRYGEIDIICFKADTMVFVEVKTRRSQKFGLPYESVTQKKINHLRTAALIYLESLEKPVKNIRFDVISILIQNEKPTIQHIEAAF